MAKQRLNEKGLGLAGRMLIVVVTVLIGLIGFAVYKNHTKTPTVNTNTAAMPTSSSETDKWYLFTSKHGEYKIRLADGLSFIGSEDRSSIYTLQQPIALGNEPGKVVIRNTGGDSNHGLFINYLDKSSDASPAGDKQTGFKTQSGLEVAKYHYAQTTEPDGIGLSKDGQEYTYIVTKDNKALTATYDIAPGETVNTGLVEKMVKTVQL